MVSLYGVLAIAIILCGLYCFKSFFSKDKEAVAPQTESVIEPESRAPFNQNSNPSDVPSDADETPSLEDSTDNISNHNGEEESTEI